MSGDYSMGGSKLFRYNDLMFLLHKYKSDFLALAGLALLTLIFFWPVTLNLGWIPHGGGDLVSFLWPTYSYAAQSLHAGRIPLWNPTLYSGAPFAADNQSGLFYPINLLTFLLVPSLPYAAMEWLVVFHIWLAGASMYFLMRTLRDPDPLPASPIGKTTDGGGAGVGVALFSAIAYMFSDVFIMHIGHLNIVATSAWLPAAFAALHLGLTRRSPGWSAGAGVILGLAVLAGHAQMTLIITVGLGLYALWRIIIGPKRLALIGLAGLTFAVAFGVSAIALIPAAEMLRYTARTQLDYATASLYSLPWAGLAGLFSPLVFGRGVQNFWGPWGRVELGYLGVLPLVFAGGAPFKNRRGVPIFLVGLGVFAWLIALGANTPLHYFLYRNVPGFAQLRAPARFILLTDFSLAVLAGLGLQRLNTLPRKRLLAWCGFLFVAGYSAITLSYHQAVAATGVAHDTSLYLGLIIAFSLLFIGLLFSLWRPSSSVLRLPSSVVLVLLLSADLIGQGAWIEIDFHDATLGFQHPKALAFLQSQPPPTRVDNASGAWSPDAAARDGLEDIGGLSNPLALAAYQTYLGAVGARGTPLYNFLNAQFVIADKNRPPADSTFVPVYNEDPAVDIYLNTNAMPRISLVYSATLVSSGEAAFGAIHAPDFNPLVSVVAEGTPSPTPPPSRPSTAPLRGSAQDAAMGEGVLYYLTYTPESYTVVARAPAPAYLVFSEVWYPGWRAWVDGVETPIFIADFAFRGIYLAQPGEHTVVMRFEPLSWKIGLGITLLTLLGLAIWLGLHLRRAKN